MLSIRRVGVTFAEALCMRAMERLATCTRRTNEQRRRHLLANAPTRKILQLRPLPLRVHHSVPPGTAVVEEPLSDFKIDLWSPAASFSEVSLLFRSMSINTATIQQDTPTESWSISLGFHLQDQVHWPVKCFFIFVRESPRG
jgi:hypothetical protein